MKQTESKTTQGCTRTEGAPVWMAGANSTGLNNKQYLLGGKFFILRLQRLLHVRGCARHAITEVVMAHPNVHAKVSTAAGEFVPTDKHHLL